MALALDNELHPKPTPPRHASRVTLHINGVPQDTEPGPITVTTSDPWTGHPLPTPTEGPRRSPHPTTPFDRRHRHTVLQHLVFPFLRALWLEAIDSAQAEQ